MNHITVSYLTFWGNTLSLLKIHIFIYRHWTSLHSHQWSTSLPAFLKFDDCCYEWGEVEYQFSFNVCFSDDSVYWLFVFHLLTTICFIIPFTD